MENWSWLCLLRLYFLPLRPLCPFGSIVHFRMSFRGILTSIFIVPFLRHLLRDRRPLFSGQSMFFFFEAIPLTLQSTPINSTSSVLPIVKKSRQTHFESWTGSIAVARYCHLSWCHNARVYFTVGAPWDSHSSKQILQFLIKGRAEGGLARTREALSR